jgi:hypothetical protein
VGVAVGVTVNVAEGDAVYLGVFALTGETQKQPQKMLNAIKQFFITTGIILELYRLWYILNKHKIALK